MTFEERREKYLAEHPDEAFLGKKCNVDGCEKTQNVRGVCAGHFTSCRLLIKEGKTTDEKLVEKKILNSRFYHHNKGTRKNDILNMLNHE